MSTRSQLHEIISKLDDRGKLSPHFRNQLYDIGMQISRKDTEIREAHNLLDQRLGDIKRLKEEHRKVQTAMQTRIAYYEGRTDGMAELVRTIHVEGPEKVAQAQARS